jgi:hypothetical protein
MRFNKHKYRYLDTGVYNVEVPYRYVYTYSIRYCAYQNSNRNNRTKYLMKSIVRRTNCSVKKLLQHCERYEPIRA